MLISLFLLWIDTDSQQKCEMRTFAFHILCEPSKNANLNLPHPIGKVVAVAKGSHFFFFCVKS